MPRSARLVALPQLCRRLRRDERGVILVLAALVLTVLIGFTGLGVETGLWYAMKRQEQTAADYAALSGAMEIAAGKPYYVTATTSGICGLAKRGAQYNGFTFAAGFTCPNATPGQTNPGNGQMDANNPPVLGANAGNANYVEVILGRQQNTLFASLFLPSVMIRSRAVAGVNVAGFACTLAVATNGSKAINIAGNTTVNMNQCGFASNSTDPDSVNFQGSATLNASWFQSAGNYNTNGNPIINVPTKLIDAAPVRDPYSCNPPTIGCAGTITWPVPSAKPIVFNAGAWAGGTLQPGTYTAKKSSDPPLSFSNGNTILCPGVYVLDGMSNQDVAFSVTGGTVTMGVAGAGGCLANGVNGVTIIATSSAGNNGGGFFINGGTVTLSAPTSTAGLPAGLPSGLLFAQDPAHAFTAKGGGKQSDSTITANGATSLTGVMYTPATNVTWLGNSNSTCFIIVALTVQFTGNSTMSGDVNSCKAKGVTGPEVLSITLAE